MTTIWIHGGAQVKYTLSGLIKEAESGEALIGANVFILEQNIGTNTNNYGFYSITVPASDSLTVSYSYLGHEPVVVRIPFDKNNSINLEMKQMVSALDEVVVTADQNDDNVSRAQMGSIEIPIAKIKELPTILGEQDVLKIIQLLPGVQAGNEGTTGFYVRGGNADQNLVQLDEAVVYNPNHLFGLFSAFNTRAINNVNLIKGGFPAQYGGRLSSILDISMKEGNVKRFGAEGGIGLISTQLTLEGPIKKEEASFIISGRRTYFDWMIKPFLSKSVKTNYAFYDFNAKVNWKIGENDHVYFSAFKGNDDALYSQDGIEYNILFGNQTGTLRWNHVFGPRLFLNTSIISNQYLQDISALQDNAFSSVISEIKDISGKMEFQFYPSPDHQIKFGGHYFDHRFRSAGEAKVGSGSNQGTDLVTDSIPVKNMSEAALYINDDIRLNENVSANLGLRIPAFLSSSVNYIRIEPRLAVKVQLSNNSSLKGSYTLMNQFLHLIPSTTASVPTDIWIPSTQHTKPQESQQYSLGWYKNFNNNQIETNVEAYYKTMKNQVLFKEGNQLVRSLDVDNLLVYGKGWSYGAEFFVKKKTGRLTGWVAYTLSWTNQQFKYLNYGKQFPFRYDRRHDLSLVGTYDLNERWSLSATFVFSSGNTYTVPVGRTQVNHGGSLFEGNYFIYQARNNARLNPYHRLNFSATYKKQRKIFKKPYDSEWVVSFYNMYSRKNPYFIYFQVDPRTDKPTAKQVSLLPIIPSISYNFKF
ncbi:MAG: TonB-dependent receptor [Saprospiraceae bacterium]|nr:TonB-dependent receptor [Saprospiraceae bacterium]